MPGGDKTGPLGLGPRTGRTLGFCSGYSHPGYAFPGFGRGFGRGRGHGLGRGYWGRGRFWRGYNYPDLYYPPTQGISPQPNKEEEKAYLEEMVKGLEEELKDLRRRLKELTEEK